jgi:uncharacterized protein
MLPARTGRRHDNSVAGRIRQPLGRRVHNHDFNGHIVEHVGHRPWPMPDRPWIMTQTWHDLLFAHWPLDKITLASKVPAPLELDLWDGVAWIGIVPFRMTNVAPRGMPSLPWISALAELNVRTYVRLGGKPGVYFFSLDASNPLVVAAARALFRLPYFVAAMRLDDASGRIDYRSRRSAGRPAELVASYAPTGPTFHAAAGTLEYFLTERYCLYTVDDQSRPRRVDIHHPPWALQCAGAEFEVNTMADAAGLRLPARAPVLHFAKRQDTVAWAPRRVRR